MKMAFFKSIIFTLLITLLIFLEETSASPNVQKVSGGRKVLVRKTKLLQPARDDGNETAPTNTAGQGCFVGSQRYLEGQYMPDVGGPCKACYCLRGTQYCTDVRCSHPDAEKNCVPIMMEGSCCPVSYNCENQRRRENSKFATEGKLLLPGNYHTNTNPDPETRFEFSPSGLNPAFLENHIRIERQSQLDHAEGNEVIATTEVAVSDDTTVHAMNVDIPTQISEKIITESTNVSVKSTEFRKKESDVEGRNEPSGLEPRTSDPEANTLEATQRGFFDDELSEDAAVTETITMPTLSISKLLSKIKEAEERNKDSISDILPDPIIGTRFGAEENYDEIPTSGAAEEPDFVSYDINVGTSLVAGDKEPVGVGQVFPVNIGHSPAFPPSRSPATEEQANEPSFLDTFLNLFTGGSAKVTNLKVQDTDFEKPPALLPPPPFNPQPPPPPPAVFKPFPFNENFADRGEEEIFGEPDEIEDIDLEAKPTIENEVRMRPKPPSGSSITRNELPIRRRPGLGGSLRPSIFANRPNFPISKPASLSNIRTSDGSLPELPSDPVIEGGFEAIKPASNTTKDKPQSPDDDEEPTLPPSLPNLQIIPFVAADAVVNQGLPPDDNKTGFTPKQFSSGPSQDCREGGKVWTNGEVVAQRDGDPCVLCRCLLTKVICQRQECPTLPKGCTAEDSPAEGECCPHITCDKAANVSIIDTLPIFHPIKNEKKPESSFASETPTRPIRPSPFAHRNRRPPFASLTRPQKPTKPLLLQRKPIVSPRRRPALGKRPVRPKKPEENPKKEETTDRLAVRRPIRPVIAKSPTRSPPKPSLSSDNGDQPRPYSSLIRTGTRRPFIPPRRTRPTTDRIHPISISTTLTPTTTTTTTTSTRATTTTTTTIPTTTSPESSPLPVTTKELILRLETNFRTELPVFEVESRVTETPKQPDSNFFENLFAGLIPKEKPFLPSPIHSPLPKESITDLESAKPFSLPPDLLLPKPLPPTDSKVEAGDLINFVQQDKFRIAQVEPIPETIFDRQPPKLTLPSPKPAFRPLPEIPESVKAQLPLGNDPILVSGLLELAGCNVYGRMFEVGEEIDDISGRCKACQCTKVGVQCLPIC